MLENGLGGANGEDTFDAEELVQMVEEGVTGYQSLSGDGPWARELVPQQLRQAGSELRPLLTLDRLGGAYLPTILFGLLVGIGLVMGITAYLIAEFELGAVFGYTAQDILVLTGICTMLASVLLLAGILWRLVLLGASAIAVLPSVNDHESADDVD